MISVALLERLLVVEVSSPVLLHGLTMQDFRLLDVRIHGALGRPCRAVLRLPLPRAKAG
jgi:hypothetical protein